MPPRKRKRDTRMAAALDNLKGYGFAETLIRKKINSFLKVYGDEGWQFIEEFSYKMVVDSICDDQEKDSMLENNESMEVEVATESCSEPQPEPEPEPEPEPQLEFELHPEPGLQLEPEPEPEPQPQPEPELQPEPVQQKKQDNCHPLDPDLLLWARKPCYGWICSDDEEDEILTLATEVSEMCTPELRKERKTRWDVKPKDM